MKEIVFASNNKNKLEEIQSMLSGKFRIISLKDINCNEELPETSDSIEGNALQKARYVFENYGIDCFADDTGLEVASLGGRPGVYSARYAGPDCSAEENMDKLLYEMSGIKNRNARFKTVIALILNGEEKLFEGIVDGEITLSKSGKKGFGYDPIFIPEGSVNTFAEMKPEDKNLISHRGRAIKQFMKYINSSI